LNYQFETENLNSYEISPQLDLERRGMGDGYYFIEIARIVFRCKILGVLDGYLDINLKESIAVDSVDYENQMYLREEFEVQKKFVMARSFIEKVGYYDTQSDSFCSPDQFEFDLFRRSISFVETGKELDISLINLDQQKSLVYEIELESLSGKINALFDKFINFFGLIYDYNVYLEVKSELTNLFVSVVELADFYPLDETLASVKDYFTQILILFKFPKPKVVDFLDIIFAFKEDLKNYKSSMFVFSNNVIDKIRDIRSLRSYLVVVSRFSNFGDRYNFYALLEFFKFLIFYSKLERYDAIVAKKLADYNFENKFKTYLVCYLDSKRVMRLLSDGGRVAVTNEVNLIEKILEHSDLMDYNFVEELKEKVIGLKMAFHLHN
tara:strand:+ start:210 stop:1349 length:1140 start_codon:yes stop_codon:yes gene_type:complete